MTYLPSYQLTLSRLLTARSSLNLTCSTPVFVLRLTRVLSVSRVGGAAQTKIIKKLGGGVRLALAQYRELAAFSQFASDLDEATRKQLERGQRVTELMKQKQYAPLNVAEMGVSLYAANEGYLDDVDVTKIVDFEDAMLAHLRSNNADLLDSINESGDYNDDIAGKIAAAIENFKTNGVY